jgi:hypothetical protein
LPDADDRVLDGVRDRAWITKDVRLPEAQDGPSLGAESLVVPSITRGVRLDLVHPVASVVPFRELREPTVEIAAVPEVAVTEHCHAQANENDVRPAG